MNAFHLIISTPDGNKYDGMSKGIYLRGADGDLAVLAGHADFITSVKSGKCKIITENGDVKIGKAEGGLLTVSKGSTTIISSSFIWE